MSTKACRALLEARVKTWADAHNPVLPIAFENVKFTKPASGIYLRTFTLPNPTDSRFMEATDRVYMGVFQVSIVAPLQTGPAAAEAIVTELEALFPLNLDLTSTLKVTTITPVSAAPALQEPDAYVTPASFSYQATTY
ncbi:phage tail terminator-like protein [Variovorax sp. J22R193]|uniref:phage tail terminator-like protein n=1 Tax=Variovorax fucosicus TaxID=3053517 RepID=UPI002576CE14|nr:phage tail terminator-like protein [Variovorax sp. J22R193]MDM0041879.1 phage tail terminator-like protein [Variovorax sp. J22R193]